MSDFMQDLKQGKISANNAVINLRDEKIITGLGNKLLTFSYETPYGLMRIDDLLCESEREAELLFEICNLNNDLAKKGK